MFVLFVMQSYLIEVRGLKPVAVAQAKASRGFKSYLIEVRGLKPVIRKSLSMQEGRIL